MIERLTYSAGEDEPWLRSHRGCMWVRRMESPPDPWESTGHEDSLQTATVACREPMANHQTTAPLTAVAWYNRPVKWTRSCTANSARTIEAPIAEPVKIPPLALEPASRTRSPYRSRSDSTAGLFRSQVAKGAVESPPLSAYRHYKLCLGKGTRWIGAPDYSGAALLDVA